MTPRFKPFIVLLADKKNLNLLFKLSYLHTYFALILDYLNPVLNNPAQVVSVIYLPALPESPVFE